MTCVGSVVVPNSEWGRLILNWPTIHLAGRSVFERLGNCCGMAREHSSNYFSSKIVIRFPQAPNTALSALARFQSWQRPSKARRWYAVTPAGRSATSRWWIWCSVKASDPNSNCTCLAYQYVPLIKRTRIVRPTELVIFSSRWHDGSCACMGYAFSY